MTITNSSTGNAARRARNGAPRRKHRTLEKGLEILGLFSVATPELTAAEIQEKLQIPTSTLYRLLRSVKAKQWIEEDGNGNFTLGLRMLELARVVRARLDIVDIARTEMVELSRRTGETTLLTAVSGNQAVCIDQVEGRQAVRVSMERGVAMPLHAGASSTVLLAFLDEQRRNEIINSGPLKRYTRNTITTPKRLGDQLNRFRARGYAFSDQEMDVGVRGIGAPIFGEDRRLIAGLTLVAPSVRMSNSRVGELARLVVGAAGRISAKM